MGIPINQTWLKFIEGDDTAFSQIYKAYYKKLHAYGLAIGFNEDICNDAIQDVFLNIFLSRKKINYIENVEFYLIRSLKNRLFDIYKIENKISKVNYDEIIIAQEENVVERIINEENQLLVKEKVEKILKKLKPRHKRIIYYRFHLNLQFNEIAIFMDMSPNAVKEMLYRILKTIRQENQSRFDEMLLILLIVSVC